MQWARERVPPANGAAGLGVLTPHAERRGPEGPPSDCQGGGKVISTASEDGWRTRERAGPGVETERARPAPRRGHVRD